LPNKPTAIKNKTGGNCNAYQKTSDVQGGAKLKDGGYNESLLNAAQQQAKHARA
jgi:hypothetical protein